MLFQIIQTYYLPISKEQRYRCKKYKLLDWWTHIEIFNTCTALAVPHLPCMLGCVGIISAERVLCEAEAGPINRSGVVRHAPHYPTGNNSIMKPVLSWRCNKLGWMNLGSATVWPQQTGWSWCLSINFNGINEREISCRRHWISQHFKIVAKIPKDPPLKKNL